MKTATHKSLHWTKTIVPEFTEFLINKGLNEKTVSGYTLDCISFFNYITEKGVNSSKRLRDVHITGYLAHCKQKGLKGTTVQRYYMGIRSLVKFLKKRKLVALDLMDDVDKPPAKTKVIQVPTRDDIERLLAQPDTETWVGCRDRAMLELLYSSGLRASELCDLRLQDVTDTSVHISEGKRDKTRTVPINEVARHWIREYIDLCRGKEPGWLFLTIQDRQMNRSYLCKTVQAYAEAIGLDYVSTHTLRHACATHFLDEGADLRTIQEVLGHASINSTQRYTHFSSKSLEDNFNKFSPRRVAL
jgi:integrase/recombinase XerD